MLHTITRSPWQCDIYALRRMLRSGDDLLLIQDGVLAAVNNSRFVELFNNVIAVVSVLKEDVEARGLVTLISSRITIVNYSDFVSLAIKHTNQMNW